MLGGGHGCPAGDGAAASKRAAHRCTQGGTPERSPFLQCSVCVRVPLELSGEGSAFTTPLLPIVKERQPLIRPVLGWKNWSQVPAGDEVSPCLACMPLKGRVRMFLIQGKTALTEGTKLTPAHFGT